MIQNHGGFATRFMEAYHDQMGYIGDALIVLANGGAGKNMMGTNAS